MNVSKFGLSKYTNEDLAAYCKLVRDIMDEVLAPDELLLFQAFLVAQDKLMNLRSQDKESYTTRLQKADALADKAWRAIRAQLDINLEHYDPKVVAAAIEVNTAFEKKGNPTRLAYKNEYLALAEIINALESLPDELLKLAMVDGWKEELCIRTNAFNELVSDKNEADSKKQVGISKAMRTDLINAHRALIDVLNVMLVVRPTSALEKFATRLEALNDEERTKWKSKATKEENEKAKGTNKPPEE